jgi:hypothetical protein
MLHTFLQVTLTLTTPKQGELVQFLTKLGVTSSKKRLRAGHTAAGLVNKLRAGDEAATAAAAASAAAAAVTTAPSSNVVGEAAAGLHPGAAHGSASGSTSQQAAGAAGDTGVSTSAAAATLAVQTKRHHVVSEEEAADVHSSAGTSDQVQQPAALQDVSQPVVTEVPPQQVISGRGQQPSMTDRLQLLGESRYSEAEVAAEQQLLDDGLMEGQTPREVKRLINQYRLAKMILLVRDCTTLRVLMSLYSVQRLKGVLLM